ncbi:uncharacterized protein LOC128728654 [Anopheles nili]|uniref:uncharacterized protein LOC128728654 n=1 Tax=Anopheles nili TaxID=185578 RepID=UPI00237B9499|nr:uncharacterized protein LOC128728654 [Anopheles nili]
MAEDLSINKNKIFTQRYGNSNNDICRLCLKNEAHMEPLFYSNLFPNILLTKKIYDCTSIQIIYERNLPMFVCKLCTNKLDEYVRFRDRCIANDEFLRNALAAFGASGAGCAGAIKAEPEDSPPPIPGSAAPGSKFAQCLGVTPMELNCALVAVAAVAAGHPPAKREPPDVDEEDDDGELYGRSQPDVPSPERTSYGRPTDGEMPLKGTLEERFRSVKGDETPTEDVYDEPDPDADPYVCEVCSKSFKIRHHLMVHRHTHVDVAHVAPLNGQLHGELEFHAQTGGSVGGTGGGGNGKQSYNCPKCAKVFVNKGNLLNHLETHSNEKTYSCDICAKTFKYNVQLRLHMRIHTGERPHKCEICNRGFSQLSNLRSHRKTHSKVKPYKCHLCLKSFTVLDNLTAHSAKCLKDKFRCTLCSKSFAKEGNLLSHLQSHSDGIVEKMFKCEMCPKSFKNKEDWKRHVRVHTGEKPYTCDICSKGFAQKANLLSHRKTHLKPNVVYKCDRCGRTFRSQKVLELHLPKCAGGGPGDVGVPSAPVTPVSPGSLDGSASPGAAIMAASTATGSASNTPSTLSEALSDLLRYEIALRAPLELQQMLLGHIDRKKPLNGVGGKATGRRYRCDVCFKGYSQYPSLIKHRKLHFKVPPLVKVLAGAGKARHREYDETTEPGADEDEDECAEALALARCTPGPPDPTERPYTCDICGGRFEAASAHPPDRCRQDLQLRVLLEPVPLERGPEAAPEVPHGRTALPMPPLSEGFHPAIEPAGSCEDPRAGGGVQRVPGSHHHQPTAASFPGTGSGPPMCASTEHGCQDPSTSVGAFVGRRRCSAIRAPKMVKEMPSSTVMNRDEECLKKSLMEVVKSDSSNICRLCLSKEQKLTRAFADENGIDDALLKKIFDCTTVKVKLRGIFPSAICAVCDLKLNEFYKFREKCIENDTFLHSLLDEPESDVDQSVPIVDTELQSPENGIGCEQAEQQTATSTTTMPSEAEKDVMAIAMNQLSSFGLRPLQDLMMEGASGRPNGTTTPLLGGGNIVSSSSSSATPSQQHGGPVPSLLATMELAQKRQIEQERTFAMAALEMAGLQAMRGNGDGAVRYVCGVCHRTFRNAYTLRRHTNLHTETNLFPCEYCGKKFNDRSNWKIHQRTHTGDNLYTCLVCLKTFISPSTLKYHRRSHRRLQSFDCRLCTASFSNYDLLEEHARYTHQDMQDFQPDEPMIDAASFVKIELEDSEPSSSMAEGSVSTTRDQENDENDRRMVDSSSSTTSSSGNNNQNEEQLAEQQRREQLLELVQKHLQDGAASSFSERLQGKPSGEMHPEREDIKAEGLDHGQELQEMQQQLQTQDPPHGFPVKEEPFDDSMDLDPSALLQQAMQEAADDEEEEQDDKQLSSSSSSSTSPSTVILFRCDYCMKIFHFLDELNAHMLLHNGAMKGGNVGGAVVLGSAATTCTTLPVPTPIITPHLAVAGGPLQHPKPLAPKSVIRKKRGIGKLSQGVNMILATGNDEKNDLESVAPPEHQCPKCSKTFRTEELRRVHEATHENDELAHKMRSCRICNKLFKCELNLLAHMRKHSPEVLHGVPSVVPSADVDPAAGDSSGNDESCSSSSHGVIVAPELQLHPNTPHPDESDEGEQLSGAAALVATSPDSGPEAPGASRCGGTVDGIRRCEICAITFEDTAELDRHVLCHFERKEAIAFVPQTDRPFQCTECHKSFKRKDYLLIHIRTHTGERRYKCDLCTSAFVHPSNLITHRKLHSSERPYRCNLCGATFKLFAGLKIHRRRCEQKRPKAFLNGASAGENASGLSSGVGVQLPNPFPF